MRIHLQNIGFKDSEYERPNQEWVCGWTRDGNPCKHGPDGDGQCTASAQAICDPKKEGERFKCTRAGAFGGPCEDGPSPDGSCACPTPEHLVCQPTRNIRARRGRAVVMLAVLSFGFLLLMLGGPWVQSFVNPGQLSSVHLAIQGSKGVENCGSCHANGDAGPSEWFKAAFSSVEMAHETGSAACLDCHFIDPGLGREQSMLVHGADPSVMDQLTNAAHDASVSNTQTHRILEISGLIQGPVSVADDGLACASCHAEHRGADHDLLFMSDNECQACHQNPFKSFNQGHPQFSQGPQASAGIVFDHARHEGRFTSEALECGSCHIADKTGREMDVLPFKRSCQGCHEQGSKDHHGDKIKKNAIAVLQLPEMEFDEDAYWPTDYAIGESLPPLMALMLLGDPQAVSLLESIYDGDGADGDLYEWLILTDDEDEPELRLDLALALKRLVSDLSDSSKRGAQVRRERLSRAVNIDADDQRLTQFSNALDAASFVMQRFQQRYLPQLADDLDGAEVSADDDEFFESEWITSAGMAGWRVDSDEGLVSYRPVAHADDLLASLMMLMQIDRPNGSAQAVVMGRINEAFENDFRTCTKCHSEQNGEIAWTSSDRTKGLSGFAKFNHSPHLTMLASQSECSSCHVLETSSHGVEMAGLETVRGFLPHRNESCTSCHAPGLANNSCLNCHQYHEERPE